MADGTMDPNSMNLLNLAMAISSKSKNSVDKEMLKLKAEEINSKQLLYSDVKDNETLITGDEMFSSQLYKSSSALKGKQDAMKNGLPVYDTADCEAFLRGYYNMSDTSDILYMANKFDASMNADGTNSYKLSAYDSVTKSPLNLDLCSGTANTVQIPVDPKEVNMTLYNAMKNKSNIDIYNENDPAFNDICYTYVNTDGKDTTLNWRRTNLLQEKLPMCIGFNCTYEGLNEFDYVQCNCTGFKSNVEIVNKFVDVAVKTLAELNLKVIYCYKVIGTQSPLSNPGIWTSFILLMMNTVCAGISYYYNTHKIDSYMNKVLYHDCQQYDPEEMSPEEFFHGMPKPLKKGEKAKTKKRQKRQG
jgi:hypothetical protein